MEELIVDEGTEKKRLPENMSLSQGPGGLVRGRTGEEHLGRGFGPKRPVTGRTEQPRGGDRQRGHGLGTAGRMRTVSGRITSSPA